MLLCESTDKDKSFKQQMIFSVNQQKDGEIRGEKISKSNGFFSDQKLDFNISKKISCKHPDIYKSGNCFKCSW